MRSLVSNIPSKPCRLLLVLSALLSFLLSGCHDEELETDYGRRRGVGANKSVNGTAVFADMFQAAGHKVFSARRLSPKMLQRTDCIVWFPDAFQPPGPKVQQCLENWLSAQSGRTLIYVGRDFDAAAWYWETMTPGAAPEQKAEYQRRCREAKAEFRSERQSIPDGEDCLWFRVDNSRPKRRVRTLQGPVVWTRDIDPTKLEIELRSRLIPSPYADVLLESEEDALIARQPLDLGYNQFGGQSQILIVTNGSFLLNLPLVNHEHRKLAGKLIDQVGAPSQRVVFLESRSGDPPISEKEPLEDDPSGLAVFHVWPTNWILMHLAVVGVLFCFWRFPIFGLPRRTPTDGPSDFGKHVNAVAELLKRSGDVTYAHARLSHYHQITRPNE
ncbi:MAG: hypothetical protein JW818_11970 [Pirellulales bacterium]|nr:hypothetical protein [Pirellulales bacterium]